MAQADSSGGRLPPGVYLECPLDGCGKLIPAAEPAAPDLAGAGLMNTGDVARWRLEAAAFADEAAVRAHLHLHDVGDFLATLRRLSGAALPERLRGDGPCQDCGTVNNPVWFTESPLWNHVVAATTPGAQGLAPVLDDPGGVLCIGCFVKRVDAAGLAPTGWHLVPEWHWETRDERVARLAAGWRSRPPVNPGTAVTGTDTPGC